MSNTAHLQHYTTGRPLPAVVWRLLSVMALLAASLALLGNQATASPYGLFLQLDSPSLTEGGADIPGQVTGRPQVCRPTSLAAADRPLVQVDYTSQTPVILKRDGTRPGAWHSRLLSVQYATPLHNTSQESPWTVGLQLGRADNDITYDLIAESYSISADSDSYALSLAYQFNNDWRVGAGCTWTDSLAEALGPAVASYLGLPPDTSSWPGVSSDATGYVVGVSRSTPRWQWGLQYDWSAPRQHLRVTADSDDYSLDLSGDEHRLEAYLAYPKGSETYFLSGWDQKADTAGTFALGLTGMAEIAVAAKDRSLIAGWRKAEGLRGQQLTLDWRNTEFFTDNHAYTGLVPDPANEMAGLGADADVSTYSLRYGRQEPLSSRLTLLSSITVHRALCNGNLLLRLSPEEGDDPETLAEYHIADGRLYLHTISVGLNYQTDDYRAALTYTSGYADANEAFEHEVNPTQNGGGEDPSDHLRAQDFFTASFTRYF